MSDIPELTDEQLNSAIPARIRRRLIEGRFESGEDIAALRNFIGLTQAEFARAMELFKAGNLKRIWRVVAERSNVSIWHADTLEELHAAIGSLPFHPWMQLHVTPLIDHPATQKWEAEEGPWPAL